VFGKGRSRRPAIVVGIVDESGADGVVQYIGDGPGEVSLRVDHPRRKARAEQVAGAFVSVVEPLCVLAMKVLDSRRKLQLRRVEHEVDVVAHKAEGLAVPAEAVDRCGEQAEVGESVVVVAEDHSPVDAARSYVEVAVRQAGTKDARHSLSRLKGDLAPPPKIEQTVTLSTRLASPPGTLSVGLTQGQCRRWTWR
jgi:hypothetical protein